MKLRFTPRAAWDLALASFVCLWTCASIVADAATAGAAPSDSKNGVTVRGDEALKLLVGNTLRSVGDKNLVPEYRYFMSERFEYRCDGWDPSNIKRSAIKFYSETSGCSILIVSVKDGRLCENFRYETCQDYEFAFMFRERTRMTNVKIGQILGRITLLKPNSGRPHEYGNPTEYDLIKGNATIFPEFDLQPKPDLLQSYNSHSADATEERRCTDGFRLSASEGISKIIGSTLISRDRTDKFDGRHGEYFDPKGRIVSIGIPAAPPEGASLLNPSEDSAGGISINRWKIMNGEFCTTENDEPTKFICGLYFVVQQKPKDADGSAETRLCVGSTGPMKFIAKGNPFAVDFTKSTGN
jgi:hypothetical protein